MSNDMKLFSVEWAAITLEQTWTGRTRTELVFLYNNLVLPGTTLARDSPLTEAYIANYSLVRKIATTKDPSSDDENIVAAFEGGRPAHLSSTINSLEVPLRLNSEN